MKKNSILKTSIPFLIFMLIVAACQNEKTERKLIGNWELINSRLIKTDSNKIAHEAAALGTMSLNKDKIDKTLIDLNSGSWNFMNFPDSIIPAAGDLSWTSTDKGDFNKIPWEMDLFFSKKYIKDTPVMGTNYFDCYQGKFKVTELKKKEHYKISGNIHKSGRPEYSWEFELKKK